MGQVYPRVGLDCVGLGQKFSTFNESGWDGSNCKKCVKVYQYNFNCLSALFASSFVGSGFVGSRTRGLHWLDWVCFISSSKYLWDAVTPAFPLDVTQFVVTIRSPFCAHNVA